jgi:hypothetical protein
MLNKETIEKLKALLEAEEKEQKEIVIDENSPEWKEQQEKKSQEFEEYHKQRLREVPLEMLDGTKSTVYAEALKFWQSPTGLNTIRKSR